MKHSRDKAKSSCGYARLSKWARDERGQVAILMAICLVMFLLFAGIAVDVGRLFASRIDLARKVDAAALAAAKELPDEVKAEARAKEYLLLNGLPDVSDVEVAFPGDADFPAGLPLDRKLVWVEAQMDVNTVFMRLGGIFSSTVHTDGVGEQAPLDIVLVLDRSGSMDDDPPRTSGTAFAGTPYERWCTWGNPCYEPWTTLQEAAIGFVDRFNSTYDKIGLVTYSTSSNVESWLTDDLVALKGAIAGAADPFGKTGIGYGIEDGLSVVTDATRARTDSVGVMVIMTDGCVNRPDNGEPDYPSPPNWDDGSPTCQCSGTSCTRQDWRGYFNYKVDSADYCLWKACESAAQGIIHYTVSLGDLGNQHREMMQLVADAGDANQNWERDNPDTYPHWYYAVDKDDLDPVFQQIADNIYIRIRQ